MKVFVYFNLHKKLFSIKALEGEKKGRVIGHAASLKLHNATFKVSAAGRARVLAEKRKNVHAGVMGDLYAFGDNVRASFEGMKSATYNPYKYDSFVDFETGAKLEKAAAVVLDNKRIFYV